MAENEYETGYLSALFSLTIDGVDLGRFISVSGLALEVEVIPSEETNTDGRLIQHYVPGRTHYGPIALSRQLTDDNSLLDWHKTVSEEGEPTRKTGEVVFYDRAGARRGAFAFEGAFIESWSCTDLDAASDAIAYEQIVMSVDRIYRAD